MGSAWREAAFDSSTWGTGTAPLGFGNIIGNELGGPEINPDSHLTVYFRRELEVAVPQLITEATVEVMSDDGAIVSLNGTEIARDNMPEGDVSFDTPALSDSNGSEGTFDSFTFAPSAFVAGTNLIAVELHNRSVGRAAVLIDTGVSSGLVCLNQEEFLSVMEAQVIIEEWRLFYNRVHPHSKLWLPKSGSIYQEKFKT